MSELLRNMQRAAGVPYDKLVKVKESCGQSHENEEMVVEEIHCPFCGDKMPVPEYFDHYMDHHHEDVMCKMGNLGKEDDDDHDDYDDDHDDDDDDDDDDEGGEEEEVDYSKKFTKGQKVKYNGTKFSVEVPDARADFVGIVPVGQEGNKKAVDLVRAYKLKLVESEVKRKEDKELDFEARKEKMLKADDKRTKERMKKGRDLDESKAESNTNMMLDRPIEWMEKKKAEEKIKVPSKVIFSLRDQLKRAEAGVKKFDGNNAHMRQYYSDLKRIVQEMLDFLTNATVEDCKMAAVYLTALKSPMQKEIPLEVWTWLATGSKPSLKDYVNVVRAQEK